MAKLPNLGWHRISTSKLSETELNECIQKKAKEIWEKKGRPQGRDLDIWLEAEKLVKNSKV